MVAVGAWLPLGVSQDGVLKMYPKLIPPVMQELIQQSKSPQNSEFSLGSLLSILGGKLYDRVIVPSTIIEFEGIGYRDLLRRESYDTNSSVE